MCCVGTTFFAQQRRCTLHDMRMWTTICSLPIHGFRLFVFMCSPNASFFLHSSDWSTIACESHIQYLFILHFELCLFTQNYLRFEWPMTHRMMHRTTGQWQICGFMPLATYSNMELGDWLARNRKINKYKQNLDSIRLWVFRAMIDIVIASFPVTASSAHPILSDPLVNVIPRHWIFLLSCGPASR